MKNYVRYLTSLLLVVIMLSAILPIASNSTFAEGNVSVAQPAVVQQNELGDRLFPGAYKGEAVKRRIKRLRATNKALDRAMKDKEKAGKQVAWNLSAVLVFTAPKKTQTAQRSLPKGLRASFAPEEDLLSDGTGEATFITYEGASDTWDGTISVTDYYTGENRVYNGEVWDFGVPDDPSVWDVTSEVYYPPDGGEPSDCPPDGGPCTIMYQTKNGDAGSSTGSIFVKASYASATTEPPGAIFRWFSRFWRCFSRTAAFVGRQCATPQPSIRNNFICALAAGVYAAGCCARYSGNNSGQGICYP
jgi:hypothetical protein